MIVGLCDGNRIWRVSPDRSPIQHHFPRQSMMFPYVSEIELGNSGSSQSGDCAHKVAMLGDGVDYYHDGIFPVKFWESNYEIDTGSVPRCIWNWEGV